MPRRCTKLVTAADTAGIVSALMLLVSLALGSAPPKAPPGHRQADNVAVLTVHGEIDGVTLRSLERRVAAARKEGFEAIVIDLDTPGGRVDSARDIAHLLKHDAGVNTVAWVNPNAFSAGTLIALACREIVVHPDATWGAAAPIRLDQLGQLIALPAAERAKIEAPMRVDLVDAARRLHHDERLVQAFVSVGLEVWMLENTKTGERVFVDRPEYKRVFGDDPPDEIAPVTPPPSGQPLPPPLPFFHALPDELNQFSGLSDEEREQKMKEQIESAQVLPESRDPLTAADRKDWRLVGQVVANDELLVLKAGESIDYGLAQATIRNDQELAAYFGTDLAHIRRFNESWSEKLVRALVSFWARAVLIVIFVLALLIELAVPGMGLFGATAAAALLLLIGAPYLAGMAQWWEILLIFVGMGLIAVEIFVIPGFGVAGIAGVLCLLLGVVGTFVSGDVSSAEGQSELLSGIGTIVIGLFAAGVGLWLLSKHAYDIPLFRRFILIATTEAASNVPGPGLLGAMAASGRQIVDGDIGIAETDLRPAGRAVFDGRLVDVVTPGEYIPAGMKVRVLSVGAFRIEVEPLEE